MKLEQLELIDVRYLDNDTKAVLVFLDEERGEIREINFNTKVYDQESGQFKEDQEKAVQVEEWSQEYFNLPFLALKGAIGQKHDVYVYDKFNSLWESKQIKKFDKDIVGQILEMEIKDVVVDDVGIKINLEYDGADYQSKMTYSDYVEIKNKWFVNPQKKLKQESRFADKFLVSVEDRDKLKGKKVMAEIKLAMGKYVYIDIKKLPRKK